jgi:hypothetical protein
MWRSYRLERLSICGVRNSNWYDSRRPPLNRNLSRVAKERGGSASPFHSEYLMTWRVSDTTRNARFGTPTGPGSRAWLGIPGKFLETAGCDSGARMGRPRSRQPGANVRAPRPRRQADYRVCRNVRPKDPGGDRCREAGRAAASGIGRAAPAAAARCSSEEASRQRDLAPGPHVSAHP